MTRIVWIIVASAAVVACTAIACGGAVAGPYDPAVNDAPSPGAAACTPGDLADNPDGYYAHTGFCFPAHDTCGVCSSDREYEGCYGTGWHDNAACTFVAGDFNGDRAAFLCCRVTP